MTYLEQAPTKGEIYGATARAEKGITEALLLPTDGGLWSRRRNAIKNLRILANLRRDIEQQIADYVTIAREHDTTAWNDSGIPWADIGTALGVSKQAAAQRYGGGRQP